MLKKRKSQPASTMSMENGNIKICWETREFTTQLGTEMANSIFLAATTAIPGGVIKLVGAQEPKNFHCNTQLSKL